MYFLSGSATVTAHSGIAKAIRKAKATFTVLPRVLTKIFAKAIANFLKPSYRPQRSWGKVMFLHVSVILFTGGVVSQHALQVSGGSPGPHPGGRLRGLLVRGVCWPTPWGSPGPHQGVSRPTPGGLYPSMH